MSAPSADHTRLSQPPCNQSEGHRWRVVVASLRGTSHEKTGQPCQDAHHWHTLPQGVLVVAVADVAGSAPLGEVGAAIAARTAVETVCMQPVPLPGPAEDGRWKLLLTDALQAARAAVEVEAAGRGTAVRDLATTLILIVATPGAIAAVQVGDGAAVVGDDAGNLIALTSPPVGEYLNETTFLSSPEALDTAQMTIWHGAAAHVAAFSDGLQMLALKMPGGAPHAPFFSPLFRFVAHATDEGQAHKQLIAFLQSPRIRERVDDDVTLLLASLHA